MSRWFRHYAGMMSDPKFGGVARRCSNVAGTQKVSRADVLFVWGCILESAAERNSAEFDWDADAIGDLLCCDTQLVQRIHDELEQSGLIEKGRICKWSARQFTSDNSTERSRKHRATAMQRCATPPETETETYTETEKKKEEGAREQVRAHAQHDPESVSKTKKPRTETPRGTRWPADAVVPEDWLAEGEAYREMGKLPPLDLRAEALKFANYWAAKSGGSATKIDWKRTWINWCLTAKGTQNGYGKSEQKSLASEVFGGLYAEARAAREASGN